MYHSFEDEGPEGLRKMMHGFQNRVLDEAWWHRPYHTRAVSSQVVCDIPNMQWVMRVRLEGRTALVGPTESLGKIHSFILCILLLF